MAASLVLKSRMLWATAANTQPEAAGLRVWRRVLRLLAIFLGAVYAAVAAHRESMNADGMSYLDQGDAWWRGDWDTALNAVWSPLYPWIQGASLRLADPSIRWEFPTVHLVNFLIYLAALACFEFFWRRLTAAYTQSGPEGSVGFPPRIWLCFGYALFIWSSLTLIEIWAVTPDLIVASVVWLAAGLLIQIRERWATPRTFLAMGAVLGVGYLAKAVLFPMSLVFLVLGALVQGDRGRGWLRMFPAAGVFALVAGPFLIALSLKEGHFTFSDVGNLTYLKHVHGLDSPHRVTALAGEIGEADHPVRTLFVDPTVYEFAEPVGGTYPLSYDPYYWYKGLVPRVELRHQLSALISSGTFYFDLILLRQGGLVAIAFVLCALSYGYSWRWSRLRGRWELLLVALAALLLYSLVVVTWRYVGGFMVLLWGGLLTFVRLPDSAPNRRLLAFSAAGLTLFVALDFAAASLAKARPSLGLPATALGVLAQPPSSPSDAVGDAQPGVPRPSRVAEGLLAIGLQRGDSVGFVGYSYDAYWARLARLKIVAEILPAEAEALWKADPPRRDAILHAFARAGATAVVADSVPSRAAAAGWELVDGTAYGLYRLPESGAPSGEIPEGAAAGSDQEKR